jgi:hypothetical protein
MSKLTDQLLEVGEQHRGTDLGGLLQWAALHIAGQDDALAEVREEYATELEERQRLEQAARAAKSAIETALAAVSAPLCPPIELGRDLVSHINLMAGHGDPDYLRKNGNSIRHVDCRTTKARAKVPNVQAQPTAEAGEARCSRSAGAQCYAAI